MRAVSIVCGKFDIVFPLLLLRLLLFRRWSSSAIAIESQGARCAAKSVGRIGADGDLASHHVKFRSMVKGADKMKDAFWPRTRSGPRDQMKDDPRVAKLGTSSARLIDGFPQFLNVLVGDMSVVGRAPLPRGRVRQGHAAPGREAGPHRPLAGGQPSDVDFDDVASGPGHIGTQVDA
ncbi:MAG: sugar transferase [Collinsella stercoris]|uniref:sugar transferase n=1 Tax=Collinsella stercoris TaxID=147206 RepID=UPI003992F4B4